MYSRNRCYLNNVGRYNWHTKTSGTLNNNNNKIDHLLATIKVNNYDINL